MCIVSVVSDDYMKRWPDPGTWDLAGRWISEADWREYQRLKAMAEELDRKLNQPDCVKPEVEDWEKKIEDYLRKKGIIL